MSRFPWRSLLPTFALTALLSAMAMAQPGPGREAGPGSAPPSPPGPFAGAPGPPGPPGPPLVPPPWMLDQLGLSDAQRERVESARDEELRRTIHVHADLRLASRELERMIARDAPDPAAIEARVRRIGELQSALLEARVATALAVRRLLTPAQRAQLRRLAARPPARADAPRGSPR